jgi:chemotaxis protein methyltransferase CheR
LPKTGRFTREPTPFILNINVKTGKQVNFGINDIKELTASMAAYPSMDYSNYALSFLKRRLSYLFAQLKIRRKEQFFEMLRQPDFREKILYHMCVETTEMFRDPACWRTLRDKILGHLPEGCQNIWVPVAASGEELFSLAILLHENNGSQEYRIIGQSPSAERCAFIQGGKLNPRHDDVNQTNYKRLEDKNAYHDYIQRDNGFCLIQAAYRRNIDCRLESFPDTLPPEDGIGLILFRNVSIYYNQKLTHRVFTQMIEKLMPGGFLVIGAKEQLPAVLKEGLIVVDATENIYKKPGSKFNNNHAEY